MVLKQKAEVLKIAENPEHIYEWELDFSVWMDAEYQHKKSIFSRHGTSADAYTFSMRPCKITRNHCILWKEHYYIPTAIEKISPALIEVTAAQVGMYDCSYQPPDIDAECRFPAVLTEKYMGYDQQSPMAILQTTYMLITPKPVELQSSGLVFIDGKHYIVAVCHTLGEFINEYEIRSSEDL